MRRLNLFAGTTSVNESFDAFGWVCDNTDWDKQHGPAVCLDITKWDYKLAYEPDHGHVVWASPDCTQYSISRPTTKATRHVDEAVALVWACIDIRRYLQPQCSSVEHLVTGLLNHRFVID